MGFVTMVCCLTSIATTLALYDNDCDGILEIKGKEIVMTPEQHARQLPEGQCQWYRHYKGGVYKVLHIGRHSETEEWLVVYANAKGDIWIRPYGMFFEDVWKEGSRVPRFAIMNNEDVIE